MSAPPFPSRKAAERSAVIGFALGTLAVTATLGLRTALFQPDYFLDGDQLAALGLQGAAELFVALFLATLALWPKRRGISTGILIVLAIAIAIAKMLFILVVLTIGEAERWTYSMGLCLMCGAVSLPLLLSFLPVAGAVYGARASLAHDGPLHIRAALCVWLGAAGLSSLILGPDLAVRVWGAVVLGAAVVHFGIGNEQEKALAAWAAEALTRGAPHYFVDEEAPGHDVPSIYEEDARKVTLLAADEDEGSYRRDPSKRPIAAADPQAAGRPRSFGERVLRMSGLPIVFALIAVGIGAIALHPAGLPPRAVSRELDHYEVKEYHGCSIEGLSLWVASRGVGQNLIVGYDPEARRVVKGEELFRRVRGVPVHKLAELANAMLYDGYCCVLNGTGANMLRRCSTENLAHPVVV